MAYCRLCGTPVKDVPIYSERQAEKRGLMQLHEWSQPGERMLRHYLWPEPHTEAILAGDWLKAEAARVLRDPHRIAALVFNSTGEQTIYVNRVAGSAHEDEEDED